MQILSECNLAQLVVGIMAGKSVVFPTETSYGLGCDATNKEAVDKVFKIKGRSSYKPLLVVVPSIGMAKKYLVWNKNLEKIASKYWPGEVTVVGESRALLANGVVSPSGTLALRVTANPLLKSITEKLGRPLVATSANISGQREIYSGKEAVVAFKNQEYQPDIILDQGDLPKRKPSTLVSVLDDKIKILRQGEVIVEEPIKSKVRKVHKVSGAPDAHSHFFMVSFIVISLGAAVLLTSQWGQATAEINQVASNLISVAAPAPIITPREKVSEQTVKGLYLTAYSAGNPAKIDEIIRLIDSTELNAVVIDIKDYTGYVLYDSKAPQVVKLKTKKVLVKDLAAVINKLHAHNIYVIARQTVFQDPVLASAMPEWSIKHTNGGLWRDNKGLSWVDPTREDVWNYNFAIAREAAALGFDEINFDYARFPSDGNMSAMVYSAGNGPKYKVMNKFYQTLGEKLSDEPVWLSLDMFGLTMESTSASDMNIGQRIVDAVDYVDYICPMMYPSHYSPGHLGMNNPANYPAEVIKHGMELGLPKFIGKRAKVRPWIQAFNLGAVYDAAKIRAQIDEVEKYSSAGWLMWNASNRYTNAGLKTN